MLLYLYRRYWEYTNMINILQCIFLTNLAHPPSIIVILSSQCFTTSHDATKNRSFLGRKWRKSSQEMQNLHRPNQLLNPLCGVFEISKPMILEITNVEFYHFLGYNFLYISALNHFVKKYLNFPDFESKSRKSRNFWFDFGEIGSKMRENEHEIWCKMSIFLSLYSFIYNIRYMLYSPQEGCKIHHCDNICSQ